MNGPYVCVDGLRLVEIAIYRELLVRVGVRVVVRVVLRSIEQAVAVLVELGDVRIADGWVGPIAASIEALAGDAQCVEAVQSAVRRREVDDLPRGARWPCYVRQYR